MASKPSSTSENLGFALLIIGVICGGWVIVKASIIGFYSNEIVPQMVIPGAVAAVCILLGLRLARD